MGFCRKKQGKELGKEITQVLEKDIFKLLNGAELFLELKPELGIPLLRQANGLYRLRDYSFKIECKINDVFFSYIKNYPSKR